MSNAAPLEFPRSSTSPILERVRLRARRHGLWVRHLWAQGMNSADQGLAITHGEVDRLLLDPGNLDSEAERFHASNVGDRTLREAIARADRALERDRDWSSMCRCFELNGQESDLLSLAVAADLDPGLGRVYGYLHDEAQACHATQWLAAQLFEWPPDLVCGPDSNLVFWRLAAPGERFGNAWSARAPWIADPAVGLSVKLRSWCDPVLLSAVTLVRAEHDREAACLYPDALARMKTFVQSVRTGSSGPVQLEIVGPPGSGKRTLAAQFAAEHKRDLLIGDAEALFTDKPADIATGHLVRMLRMARASGAIPYWRFADAIGARIWRAGRGMYDLAILDRDSASGDTSSDSAIRHSVRLSPLARAERLALWQRLSDEAPPALVLDRQLLVGEIAMAARVAQSGDEAVRQASAPIPKAPPELLQPLRCPYRWEDLVLTADVRQHLEEFEQQARLRWSVYEEWGFERLVPLGKGITALFAGASGTGKTMAAQVIARSLDLDLFRVDLAGVVNKYIGETEKRLKQVFDYCERANVMLLFDEADALFGQRTQVKDAHDRFANIEIDYLLQRMEQFSGIAVLATNRKNDLDKAFVRRLRFIVDFLPPGPQERLVLWQRALLPHSPAGEPLLDQIDWSLLADKLTMTGADIKSAALAAAFLARAEGTRIGMRHLVAAAKRETTKHGVVLRVDLTGGSSDG
jgi:AAA+ superfamily predicted ATPase